MELVKNIFLALLISVILLISIFAIIINTDKCVPHCSGSRWNISDGCRGRCSCKEGGKEQPNGICCYPNCKGLTCGSDGCGGMCSCDVIPNGKCMDNKQCDGCPDGECLINNVCQKSDSCCPIGQCKNKNGICVSSKICCYAQQCDGVFCGTDGCGGTCSCQQGSTCSSSTGSGVCTNSGTPDWIYSVLDKKENIKRMNVSDAKSCSAWIPDNLNLNLQNFPCKSNDDCPYMEQCKSGFCNRNNVYQYWYYDPTDPSGFNCTKILQGSNVCGLQKQGTSSFDVIKNVGADKAPCGQTCVINPVCPETGMGSCCPKTWISDRNSARCIDENSRIQCCLNNPDKPGYSECISSGYNDCSQISDVWWRGNKAEINNVCDSSVISGMSVNKDNLSLFESACIGLEENDKCTQKEFGGFCRKCEQDGKLRCFPERMCVNQYVSSGSVGICSSENIC